MNCSLRENWIDNAKGIAILLVIMGHVDVNWAFAHGFHLVVFFVISGYTFKCGPVTNEFLGKKFSRLMTPYFYTCLAVMIMDVINSYCFFNQRSIADITAVVSNDLIRDFFASGTITQFGSYEVGSRIGAIWFLPALFLGLTIFRALSHSIRKDFFLLLSTILVAIIAYISAAFIWLPFSIQSGMLATPFICIGYIAKKRALLNHMKWQYCIVALIILLLGIKFGFCRLFFVSASMPDVILSPITGMAGFLIVYFISSKYKGPILKYIGRISLTIMCVHLFALETMEGHFNYMLDAIEASGISRIVYFDIIHVLFAVLGAVLVEFVKKKYIDYHKASTDYRVNDIACASSRDSSVDVARGILIVSIIVGHFAIDEKLRAIIFSCHMIAFVFFSGYFYNSERSVKNTIRKMTRTLIMPYVAAVVLVLLLSYKDWSTDFFIATVAKYGLGISFSKELFPDAASVGPIYFILLLFVVRIIYLCINHIGIDEFTKWIVVFVISLIGVLCGSHGYWLPWSIDVACYAIVFYQAGILVRKYNMLSKLDNNKWVYFLLSPLWAYMIYSGSMEIAIRDYGNYGLVIAGSIAGTMTVYMLAKYIADNLNMLGRLFAVVGRASIYILVVHTVMGGRIGQIVSLQLNSVGMLYMIALVLIQVMIAVVAYLFVDIVRGRLKGKQK